MVAVASVVVLGYLVVWAFGWVWRRVVGATARSGSRDAAGVLLAGTVRLLAAERAGWGQAMVGELDRLDGRGRRWLFVLGCLRATLLLPPRRGESGRLAVALVTAGAGGCVGLVAYGLTRYPGLRTGTGTWLSVAAFLVVLAGYPLITLIVSRRLTGPTLAATRTGLLGGLITAVLWLLIGAAAAYPSVESASAVVALAIPVTALAVGATVGWRGRSAAAGREAVALSAVTAGLVVFLGWVGQALLTGGRPYDPGLIRDFHHSGSRDLATYAVSDNLGAAMMLLLLVPILTAAVGLLGVSIAARLHRAGPNN